MPPQSPPPAVKIWSRDERHAVATWNNVLITHWADTPTVGPLGICETASFDLASRFAPGIVVFNVITSGITLPDAQLRKKSSEVLASTGGHVRCTATCILGEGFWASTARAMVAGITLLSRQRHPHKVYGDVGVAAAWCGPLMLPDGASPDGLLAVIDSLRAEA
jgi:hypothetical protein